jgi:hypothetical protein
VIWETLFADGRLPIKYHAFLKYLRRCKILPDSRARAAPEITPSPPAADAGFRFSRHPKEEDLA